MQLHLMASEGSLHGYGQVFLQLIRTPFQHADMVWGVVPLYFGWLINETNSSKASYRTAAQTGFALCWAAAHWLWQYFGSHPARETRHGITAFFAVNMVVTVLVLAVGLLALISGIRGRFPKYGSFLGHTRFSAYFMIAIFPIQSNYLSWSWDRLMAILVFAVPIWLSLHVCFLPLRRAK